MTIAKARLARSAQGHALAALAGGQATLRDTLRDPPEALHSVDLWYVLLRVPGIGKDRARTLCERSRVWPHLTLGELTKVQRVMLLQNLPERVQ